jgi:hypothetical protein
LHALPIRMQTGDLVFFHSTKIVSFFSRLLSWSDFDHVGVVVMSSNRKLRLLEAVTEKGVVVLDFETAIEM